MSGTVGHIHWYTLTGGHTEDVLDILTTLGIHTWKGTYGSTLSGPMVSPGHLVSVPDIPAEQCQESFALATISMRKFKAPASPLCLD